MLLRDLIQADLAVLFEQQNDPDANRMANVAPRDREAFLEHWTTNILRDEGVVKKTIVDDGRVAGYLVCFNRDGKRLVGYWLGKRFWGKGIASRALPEFLAGIDERPLHAFVAKHNLGSVRVLEKCGFELSGTGTAPAWDKHGDVEEFFFTLA